MNKLKLQKKTISSVIASSLLVVIIVLSVFIYQNWSNKYYDKAFTNIEEETQNINEGIDILTIKGDYIYLKNKNKENISLKSLLINNKECKINNSLKNGLNSINISNCLSNLTTNKIDISLITKDKILEKTQIISENKISQNTQTNQSEPSIPTYPANLFVTVWQTNITGGQTASNQIKLPIHNSGTYNFTVDWGDGTNNQITSYNQEEVIHTYLKEGKYTIKINGTLNGLSFLGGGDNVKLLEIKQWGNIVLGTRASYFSGCQNLQITATDILNTTGSTSFAYLFYNNYNLTKVPNIGKWDTSKVTTLYQAFRSAKNFNDDISSWNTSKVTNMVNTFVNAQKFNSDLSSWNTSSLKEMMYAFDGAKSFNSNLTHWDVSKVKSMYRVFAKCENFNGDLSLWDTSNVTTMLGMFSGATSFNSNISSWNVSSVKDFSSMFDGASVFNQDLNSWKLKSAESIRNMFKYTLNFNSELDKWNTSTITNMYGVFFSSKSFNQDISSWDTSNVTTMAYIFSGTSSFNQDISSWNVSKVKTFYYGFVGSNLSTSNYSQMLISWANLSRLENNTPLYVNSNLKYNIIAQSARDKLINDYNWQIHDGGVIS